MADHRHKDTEFSYAIYATWHLSLKGIAGKVAPVSGGFEEVTPLPRRSSMNNSIHAAGGNDFFGGTGKVN